MAKTRSVTAALKAAALKFNDKSSNVATRRGRKRKKLPKNEINAIVQQSKKQKKDNKSAVVAIIPMSNENVSLAPKEDIQEIFSVCKMQLEAAQIIINKYRKSVFYQELKNKDFDKMNDIDAICFSLIREAGDTKKLNSKRLNQLINNNKTTLDRSVLLHTRALFLAVIYSEPRDLFDCNSFSEEEKNGDYKELVHLKSSKISALNKLGAEFLFYNMCNGFIRPLSANGRQYLNLSGLNLKNADLRLSSFHDIDWSGTQFENANLQFVLMQGANLSRVGFKNTNFESVVLEISNWEESDLSGAKISKAIFLKDISDVASLKDKLDQLLKKIQRHEQMKNEFCQAIVNNIVLEINKIDERNLSDDMIKEKLALAEAAILHPIFKDVNAKLLEALCKLRNDLHSPDAHERMFKNRYENNNYNYYYFFRSEFTPNDESKNDNVNLNTIKSFFQKHGSCYKILNINQSATEKEIISAFRKLAVVYHPDKNTNKEDNGRYAIISEAKEILLNHRSQHDQSLGIRQNERPSFGF